MPSLRLLLAMVMGAALAVALWPSADGAVVTDPPNTEPTHILDACYGSGANTTACTRAALVDFDAARAKEGLAPMTLPSDFSTLSVPVQLLVLANIDRVDRGLPPYSGLSAALNSYAQQGAVAQDDPPFPPWTGDGGGNWASPYSSLLSEFLWMYDDGPGSGNLDCTATDTDGCWGHRDNVLANFPAPLVMGAGADVDDGDTQLFLGGDTHDTDLTTTWASVVPYFPVGVSSSSLTASPTTGTASLTVWASGLRMAVTAVAPTGWSVTPSSCDLAAGTSCVLTVSTAVAQPAAGALLLTGPNGTVPVALSAAGGTLSPSPSESPSLTSSPSGSPSGSSSLSSSPSPSASQSRSAAPRAPSVPVAHVTRRGTTVTLRWTVPAGGPITGYRWRSLPGRHGSTGPKTRRAVVRGLKRGHTYRFSVGARNATGWSAWSHAVRVRIPRG